MRNFCALVIFFLLTGTGVYSQTCTIAGAGTILWDNSSPPTCTEGGNAGAATTIIIPVGVTLEFDNVADTWTGTVIEIYGVLLIDQADITINSNLRVRNGGVVSLAKKLNLGTSPTNPTDCNFTVIIDDGGLIDVLDTGTDLLRICGSPIMKGAGSCNTCGGTNSGTCTYDGSPYCEPTGGFRGALSYSKNGFDASLPIELLSFRGLKGMSKISLLWTTASELNFDFFEIQKSKDGKEFYPIGTVKGNGTTTIRQDYSFNDEKPTIGKNYYQLKSVDFDGYTEYFDVVMVDFDGKRNFSVYPNPSDGVTFTTETNFTPKSRAFVAIYTTIGAEIARYEVSGDVSTLALPVKLESGVYFAKYISPDFISTTQVLVK